MRLDWNRFKVDIPYRLEVLQALLSSPAGRAVLSDLVAELQGSWKDAPFSVKMEILKMNAVLKAAEKWEVNPEELYPGSFALRGVSFGKVVKWTGITALTMVAGYGLVRIAPVVIGAAVQTVGVVAGVLIRGGVVAVPALLKWSTASGARALGVSLGLIFASEWAYSKIVGRKSLVERALSTAGDVVTSAPGAVKTGLILAISLFAALAIYNFSKTKNKES